jgi:signal transduction histidine kinase
MVMQANSTLTAPVSQADKLAALGTLAAGVAHEVNNPIGVICSRVELMLLDADAHHLPRQVRDDLGVLQHHAWRVAQIAQRLLWFARHSPWSRRRVDLNTLVEETVILLEPSVRRRGITVRRLLASTLPAMLGDPEALRQVLVNVLTNARDAIGGRGEIEIRTAVAAGGRDVTVSVHDTGPGIRPDVLPRIFDPFFTTRPEAAGLGLSMAYGIVRDHDGAIDVDSRVGEGTTFTLTFPAADGHERA